MSREMIRLAALVLVLAVTIAGVCAADRWDPLAVERQVYAYLTEELMLSSAASCGILANMEYESGFQVTVVGDYGTSFGLCQWHNGRYAALKSYCFALGLDYKSVEGQMAYLAYELKSSYSGLYGALRAVDNTPEGAYRAAYLWCVQFERPADMERKAVERGNSARYKYWNRYNSVIIFAVQDPEPAPEEIVEQITEEIPAVTVPHRLEYEEQENQPRRYVAEKPEKRYYVNKNAPEQPPVSNGANGFAMAMLFSVLGDGVDRKYRLPEPEVQELPEEPEGTEKAVYTPDGV